MQPDQKLGLALAVLVIGFAGAFCYRIEPLDQPPGPDPEEVCRLDELIELLPVRAYTARQGASSSELSGSLASVLSPTPTRNPRKDMAAERSEHPPDTWNGDMVQALRSAPDPIPLPAGNLPTVNIVRTTPTGATPQPLPTRMPGTEKPQRREPSPPSPVDPPSSATPPTQSYVVKSGDTLSSLATRFLGDSNRYREIFDANQDVLQDPDRLSADTILQIPLPRRTPTASNSTPGQEIR